MLNDNDSYLLREQYLNSERLEHEAKMAREYEGIIWETISALKPVFSRDGNQFCFLFGENLQEGIAGFGDTTWLAAENFYNNLHSEEIKNGKR